MKNFILLLFTSLLTFNATANSVDNSKINNTEVNTNSLYRTLIRSVETADFALMAKVYHPDAVLVSPKKTSAIVTAIQRWKKDGEALMQTGGRATLAFRFSSRLVNENTAFETGIYRYSTIDKSGKEDVYYAHFQDLNIKKSGTWLTLMENQTATASQNEWQQLAHWQ